MFKREALYASIWVDDHKIIIEHTEVNKAELKGR